MNFIESLKNNLTVPNALSFMRIIIVVPFVMSVLADDYITAVSILVISGITDILDGMIARKFNQVTELGKIIDPTADKVTLMAVMICVGLKFPAVYPFMIILILKEVLMLTAGGILVLLKEKPSAARWYGKMATAVFYVSIVMIIGAKAFFGFENAVFNEALMLLTAICMFYAVFRYGEIFLKTIKTRK